MGKATANGGWTITVLAPPQVKERPRLGRRRKAFTPEKTLLAEAFIRSCWDGPVYEGPVRVKCAHHKDKTIITVTPVDWKSALRGDIDNYDKTVLDGLTIPKDVEFPQGAFANDRMVMELHSVKK